jgi:hypothetical protein
MPRRLASGHNARGAGVRPLGESVGNGGDYGGQSAALLTDRQRIGRTIRLMQEGANGPLGADRLRPATRRIGNDIGVARARANDRAARQTENLTWRVRAN